MKEDKIKKIIKTQRCWDLRVHKEVTAECLDVREFHDDGVSFKTSDNYISIPVEAVDELVLELLKFKVKYGGE